MKNKKKPAVFPRSSLFVVSYSIWGNVLRGGLLNFFHLVIKYFHLSVYWNRDSVNNPKTRNIEPHPTKSRIVVKAFEEYAKGTHTLGTISDFLADHGVSTKGTPPAKASVARMLSNRVYLGFTYHKGEYYDGSFALIISPTLFDASGINLTSTLLLLTFLSLL